MASTGFDGRQSGFLAPGVRRWWNDGTARLVILLAGVAAVAAALLSLLRLRSREAWFSELFAGYSELIPDIRASSGLKGKPPERVNALDKGLQGWSEHFGPPYVPWGIALLVFAAADVVAFALTCAECDARWLPADEDRWQAWLTCDDPPELVFYVRCAPSGSSAPNGTSRISRGEGGSAALTSSKGKNALGCRGLTRLSA